MAKVNPSQIDRATLESALGKLGDSFGQRAGKIQPGWQHGAQRNKITLSLEGKGLNAAEEAALTQALAQHSPQIENGVLTITKPGMYKFSDRGTANFVNRMNRDMEGTLKAAGNVPAVPAAPIVEPVVEPLVGSGEVTGSGVNGIESSPVIGAEPTFTGSSPVMGSDTTSLGSVSSVQSGGGTSGSGTTTNTGTTEAAPATNLAPTIDAPTVEAPQVEAPQVKDPVIEAPQVEANPVTPLPSQPAAVTPQVDQPEPLAARKDHPTDSGGQPGEHQPEAPRRDPARERPVERTEPPETPGSNPPKKDPPKNEPPKQESPRKDPVTPPRDEHHVVPTKDKVPAPSSPHVEQPHVEPHVEPVAHVEPHVEPVAHVEPPPVPHVEPVRPPAPHIEPPVAAAVRAGEQAAERSTMQTVAKAESKMLPAIGKMISNHPILATAAVLAAGYGAYKAFGGGSEHKETSHADRLRSQRAPAVQPPRGQAFSAAPDIYAGSMILNDRSMQQGLGEGMSR